MLIKTASRNFLNHPMLNVSPSPIEWKSKMTVTFNSQTEPCRPLVSAVLALRNEERHIAAVLKSLLQQETTNFELEIIVVDGDSSDATPRIVKRIACADPRVKLEINKQKKTPYAFNLGIQASRGEYVWILGAHTAYANYIVACLEGLWCK